MYVLVLLGVLSAVLLIYYVHMRYILGKYFANSLKVEKQRLNCLFLVFLLAYTSRAAYQSGYGTYYNLVC